MYEDKKIENWNSEYIAQFIDAMHRQISPLSYTSNTKTILSQIAKLFRSISLL